MESPLSNVGANQLKVKVSRSARLIAALSYTIPAIGGALSSLALIKLMSALRTSENVGIEVVMNGMAESTIPALGSLYLGIFCGFIVIIVLIVRMRMKTKTASPSSWFFVICGFLFLVPAGLFFEAESMIIEVLTAPIISMGNAEEVGATVGTFLVLSVVAAAVVFLIMLVLAVLPFSVRSKPKWSPLITATLVEFLLIATTVAFQLRFLWLYKA